MNDTCAGMNLTPAPHLLSAATLPRESQKTEHVNTTSAFNVNYIIAVTCIKLH